MRKVFMTAAVVAAGVSPVFAGSHSVTVGVSWSNFQEERWKTDEAAIMAKLEELGATYISADAQLSAAKQLTDKSRARTIVVFTDGVSGGTPEQTANSLRQQGISIIVTEQYARPVLPIVDYAFILENGAAVLEGTRQELMNNPDIRSAYFGI